MQVSEKLWPEAQAQPRLSIEGKPHDLAFDADGNLP